MGRQRQWRFQNTFQDGRISRRDNSNSSTRLNKTWFTGRYGYKDMASARKAETRRTDLKRKVLAGVRDFNVERYRKNDKELKSIRNTEVRAYYEAQNQKLNDWAEVDSLVWSLADDIIDSTNPDADHDGIIDRTAPLYSMGHDLEAFLPLEERDKRRRNHRVAQRALNV